MRLCPSCPGNPGVVQPTKASVQQMTFYYYPRLGYGYTLAPQFPASCAFFLSSPPRPRRQTIISRSRRLHPRLLFHQREWRDFHLGSCIMYEFTDICLSSSLIGLQVFSFFFITPIPAAADVRAGESRILDHTHSSCTDSRCT